MWLDRLSGHSTPGAGAGTGAPSESPPPGNRAYSPAPRKPSHLAPTVGTYRPAFSPRSSSLSLKSNDSTTSLLASSKRATGSGLRQSTAIADVRDPLRVLADLLQATSNGTTPGDKLQAVLPTTSLINGSLDDAVEIDFEGLGLRSYAEDVDSSVRHSYTVSTQTIEEYERDKLKFEDLHRSIRACDDVLSSVETNLSSFQTDLAAVSAEIETLQARSSALSIRLDNRKLVEGMLGPIVEKISVSPAVVKKIVEGAIDEAWVKALGEVEKRSNALDARFEEAKDTQAIRDLKPLLTKLISKALERIRDFMVAQIKALRSPNINAQIIQQQHFIRYKDLYSFLYKHHPQLAEEIGQAYMNTMRWYFLAQFTRYQKALEKVKIHVIDKRDVLGHDDGTRKSSLLSAAKSSGPIHDAFNLGRRVDLLKTSNQTALSSFLAEEDKTTHFLEFPFRNFNLALVDNASAEYSFLTSFFSPSLSFAAISQHFSYVFEPTFALGRSLTKSLVIETYDCLGMLLCVRLNQHFAFELQRRKMPACEGYINATGMLLWPRFQVIMDQHCDSVRNLTSSISVRKQSALEQAKQSAAPHFMIQRFGQLMHGILSLSTEAGDDEPVSASLIRLRSDIENFLAKSSRNYSDPRKKGRFLYNNYSLILTIISDVKGKQALEQQEHFEALKDSFGEAA